jgi:ribonuclease HI
LDFDGSITRNPGGIARYGWRLTDARTGAVLATGRGEVEALPKTNNTAEWTALVRGLEYVRDNADRLGLAKLIVRGDSQLVIRMLSGRYKPKKPYLAELLRQAESLIAGLNCRWRCEWVSRSQNREADAISR